MKKSSNDLIAGKTTQTSFEVNVLVTRIMDQFALERSCLNTIGNSDIRTKVITDIRNIADIVIFNTTDKFLHGNLSLNSIEVQGEFVSSTMTNKTIADSFGAGPIPPGETRFGELNIVIDIQKESEQIFGAKNVSKRFSVIVKVDDNYIVQNCYNNFNNLTKLTREQFCHDLAGLYNPNTGCKLVGGFGVGKNVKAASCEMLGGFYNEVTGKCGVDLSATCSDGEYLEGFNLAAKSQTCLPLPK